MTINQNLTHFAGRPVEDWDPKRGLDPGLIYRLSLDYDEIDEGKLWADLLAQFLDDPASVQAPGLVVGDWGASECSTPVVEALVNARSRMPNLRALFLGD